MISPIKQGKIKGRGKLGFKTKDLTPLLDSGDIAIIRHEDIDEIAARSLCEANIKAVINLSDSMTGYYPNQGPRVFIEHSVPLIDQVDENIIDKLKPERDIFIDGECIYQDDELIGRGRIVNLQVISQLEKIAENNFETRLREFVENTFQYAIKEKDLMLKDLYTDELSSDLVNLFYNRHCVIVVRGKDYRKDLDAISEYINEENPVLIGVDGGADALIEYGFSPDIVIGDMDSISDYALNKIKNRIVHAYPNGSAPGAKRLKKLGLDYNDIPAPGTSEDLALLLAYQMEARLLVALGTHTHVIDFLEKGRQGMASTFLARLKVGEKLVDAKGVSQLYRPRVKLQSLGLIVVSAILPVVILAMLSPIVAHFFRLLYLYVRLFF
ncbi:putative cytokinetic ring protein SteA [Natranaerobius thermophilus]|uniref:Thiamin pyrophosphokinase catalytic region n=1 Tax=Natranaerobius thermophilus (strain ATCC BAA-1301 / DSM 18059 / JW/NM-WN-LF) TaxID=457570 RepID=B2A519_NATTJ|nr:putative cytokinetic ring protein SteA [Natranaerobius thermophilus]ACB85261.1 Thiamin pyrophosphokinase catalytic region [Natranaerobius thermophilus JW/NM-WN-LF]